MAKYSVCITRITYEVSEVKVDAETREQAVQIAMGKADDLDYILPDIMYDLADVNIVKE